MARSLKALEFQEVFVVTTGVKLYLHDDKILFQNKIAKESYWEGDARNIPICSFWKSRFLEIIWPVSSKSIDYYSNSTGAIYIRATPLVLNVWPCKFKLDEKMSKHASLAMRLVKGKTSLTPTVDGLDCLIGPGGLLLIVSHLFAVSVFVLGVDWKKVNN